MKILYCDKSIIVCIKPAGVVSEEAPGGMPDLIRAELSREQTAADAAKGAALCASGTVDDRIAGFPVYPVHRLDKGVGGVMVYARTKEAAADLTRQITEKTFTKEYLAVVEGIPEPSSGRMEDLLFHSARENRTYVVKSPRKGVKEAILEYEVLQTAADDSECGRISASSNEETPALAPVSVPALGTAPASASVLVPGTAPASAVSCSLVRIRLLTGRTHQIRAQFSSRHLPLIGDRRYGAKTVLAKTPAGIALWSHRLSFRHPVTGAPLVYEAAPPADAPWQQFAAPGEAE